jgi:hypothetical protein
MDDTEETELEIRRGYALQCLKDARAAVCQVGATAAHNGSPEWLLELERCKKSLAEAEETVARFEAEIKKGRGE